MSGNRKRNNSINIYLTDDELEAFNRKVEATGYNKSELVRALLRGFEPRPLPPIEYKEMTNAMRAIGNNLNQIAVVAHHSGYVNVKELKRNLQNLNDTILKIEKAIELPLRSEK